MWIQRIRAHGIEARYYRKTTKGIAISRNLGALYATGDILVFLDDDVTLHSAYLREILKIYEMDTEKKVGGVGGIIVSRRISDFKRVFLRFFCLDSKRQGKVLPSGACSLVTALREPMEVDWLSGCGMSYRRGVFGEFSFDEKFVGNGWGDDRDFSYRVRKKHLLIATPHASLEHHEEPRGRASKLEFGRLEIRHFKLFFEKNIPKSLMNRFAHQWSLFGIVAKNLLACRISQTAGNLQGLFSLNGEMKKKDSWTRDKKVVLTVGFWCLVYLLYPTWLLPLHRGGRISVLTVFILYILTNGYLFLKWIKQIPVQRDTSKATGNLFFDSRWGQAWMFLAILTAILHFYPMGFPLRDDDDEAAHVTNALTLKEKVESLTVRALEAMTSPAGRWIEIGGGGLVLVTFFLWRKVGKTSKKIFAVGLGGILLIFFWRLVSEEPYRIGLLHHPPLAKLLNLVVYLILGVSEFKIRIPPLIFSILTSLFIFKLVSLYRSQDVAFLSALFILFLPNCFYYAGVAELGGGTLFFITLSVYLGLRILREGALPAALLSFVFAGGIGFFYHRTAVISMGILLFFFLWMRLRGICDSVTLKRWLVAFYFASVPILLWFFVAHFLAYHYNFAPTNFMQPQIFLRYFVQIPSQIGYPLFFFFLIGFVRTLFRRKDPLTALCFSWFFIAYLFFTGEAFTQRLPFPRYALALYGPVAVLMADLMGTFIRKSGVFERGLVIGVLLVSLLAASTVISMPPIQTRYTTFLQRDQSSYAIYDEAIPYMIKVLPSGTRIFDTLGSNHFKFYLKKYRPPFIWNEIEEEAILFEPRNPHRKDEALYQKCLKDHFEYVFCESGTLSRDRFRLVKAFEKGTKERYLWKVL